MILWGNALPGWIQSRIAIILRDLTPSDLLLLLYDGLLILFSPLLWALEKPHLKLFVHVHRFLVFAEGIDWLFKFTGACLKQSLLSKKFHSWLLLYKAEMCLMRVINLVHPSGYYTLIVVHHEATRIFASWVGNKGAIFWLTRAEASINWVPDVWK